MTPELMILEGRLETDAEAAIRLLRRAFGLAKRQGNVAVALQAAARLAVKVGDHVAEAQDTLDILEGRRPGEADWMRRRLARLGPVAAADLQPAWA